MTTSCTPLEFYEAMSQVVGEWERERGLSLPMTKAWCEANVRSYTLATYTSVIATPSQVARAFRETGRK